jgi:hypothetical protein
MANGRVGALSNYKVDRPIVYEHGLVATDFPMTETVYSAFKDFVAKDPNWKVFTPQLDKNRQFIEQQLRFQMATAAFGTVASLQVLTKDDPQIAKAIDVRRPPKICLLRRCSERE